MVEISASILNVENEDIIKTIYNLEVAAIDYFHIDVMDGEFVENNTEKKMAEYTSTIKHISNLPLDVHLMVDNHKLEETIQYYLDFRPNIITLHYEAAESKEELFKYIKVIKENGIKVGVSIKPETKIEEIFEILPYVHLCLIMTVEPGKGGQALIPETIDKIRELKTYIERNHLDLYIEADGGINNITASVLNDAGVDILVVGSYLIKSVNYKETVKELKKE